MIVNTRAGISLHVIRRPWFAVLWRRWRWMLLSDGELLLDGYCWTRRTAVMHGRIFRALRIAGNRGAR